MEGQQCDVSEPDGRHARGRVGACEQHDTYSRRFALWRLCNADKASRVSASARATAKFQRMGGVFVLPATMNGHSRSFFIVDSGAANVQIPGEVVEEMRRKRWPTSLAGRA